MKTFHKTNRIILNVIFVVFVSVCMTGCGTTSSVVKPIQSIINPDNSHNELYVVKECIIGDSSASQGLCEALSDYLHYSLFDRGLYESSPDTAQREIKLTITYYRKVGSFVRGMFGVMTGKDGIDVRVDIINRKEREVIGIFDVSSYNVTAVNISEKQMVVEIANKIVKELTSKNSGNPT